MYSGDQPMGYANANDAESIRTIHAALAGGITLFDTAAAYGAGHAERLLARALKTRPDAKIVTKIGIAIDEETKRLTGAETSPESVLPAIDRCLRRLKRDRIDLLLLHQNDLPVPQADAMFDQMERAVELGKIRAFGWSTDFADSINAVAARANFVAVEHALNVLINPPRIQMAACEHGLSALIRSPLAMGVLTGKYGADATIAPNDIRGTQNVMTDYFLNGRSNPKMLAKLNAVRSVLTTGGRSLAQGAICWLWSKGDQNIPIPGARTVTQIEELAEALSFGALPDSAVAQIEELVEWEPGNTPDRCR